MGKGKRGAQAIREPAASGSQLNAPQVDLQLEQRSSEQAESSAAQSVSPVMDVVDSSLERPAAHQTPINQSHISSRPKLLKHSRHPFGRHYSRRGSSNHSDASPSYWKGSAAYEAPSSFKLESKDLAALYGELRGITFQKQEWIRSNTFSQNAGECRICLKRSRANRFITEGFLSSLDHGVVAVLVCGHAFHADCLEQKTSLENKQDPPCPLCVSQTSRVMSG